jgi:AcrR family transcriptional regulator
MFSPGDPPLRLRNVPAQARSRERLHRVLTAADEVLAREGSAAFATTRIAEVAGVPVGSVYHFFADKEAIAEALAVTYWDELAERVERIAVGAGADGSPEDPAGTVLHALADGLRSRPGFLALWYGGLRTAELRDVTRPARKRFAESLQRIFAARWPDVPVEQRDEVVQTLVVAGDGLLREAFRLDPAGDPEVLAESHTMLTAYAASRLGG